MAFTAYRTWVASEIVSAAQFNEQIRDNGNYLVNRPMIRQVVASAGFNGATTSSSMTNIGPAVNITTAGGTRLRVNVVSDSGISSAQLDCTMNGAEAGFTQSFAEVNLNLDGVAQGYHDIGHYIAPISGTPTQSQIRVPPGGLVWDFTAGAGAHVLQLQAKVGVAPGSVSVYGKLLVIEYG